MFLSKERRYVYTHMHTHTQAHTHAHRIKGNKRGRKRRTGVVEVSKHRIMS